MKCWAQIVTTPTADTPGTALLLHFDSKRYLIGNLAEGIQRASIQRKFGLIKVSDIFLTGTLGWSNSGGLLGLILTIADMRSASLEEKKASKLEKLPPKNRAEPEKNQSLTLHGGSNLTHLLATSRRFIFRKGMPITTNEFTVKRESKRNDWAPSWRDENIKVWTMVIEPEESFATLRKRSHDEISDSNSIENSQISYQEDDNESQFARMSVVSSMFDSSWRYDTLVKRKLSEVKLPATIFRRGDDGKIQIYKGPTISEDSSVGDLEVLVRNPWPGALVERLPSTTPSKSSICYIIKNYAQRGKFNPQRAKELGVTPGPDFSRLTKGESVIATTGDVVTPEMVLGRGKDGGGFAVLEVPNESYIEPLFARKEWSSDTVMLGVGAIFWILGPGVINDPRLKMFMKEHDKLKHIVSSVDCCPNYLALESAATAAIRLNILDSKHFPIPDFNNKVQNLINEDSDIFQEAKSGMILQLEPTLEIQDKSIVPLLNTNRLISEFPKEVKELAEAACREIENPEYLLTLANNQSDILCKNAEVVTLGTGSSLPSKYRNVSATIVLVPGFGNYLFDCGENTLGQLRRVFGAQVLDVLRNLKVIWISHLHADHHLGTVSVIKAWHEEIQRLDVNKENKLIIASDLGMINWLNEYAEVEDYGYNQVELIALNEQRDYEYHLCEKQSSRAGLSSIQACRVEHCAGALAVVFKFPNGFKIAYSGDCRPSSRFVKIGQGATLLIHEATFDDELRDDAIAKKHSTTSEALEIGKRMNARRILLTHFSQRYQKIPIMNDNKGKDQVAIVAFDYMKIKIEDFAKMEAFKPALIKLYEEKED
ncbi:Ribonuclease Z [Erysiphe necator]|uniref:ribonuclease Z n=1 Tax=Uncinula necator TaxID=52586 RepID=A0A0B1PG32_UNCNE|nr:Ribonuclease Z [Erysiphe necator]KHJ35559.1 putative trna processing endoribonuclease protein [Erysiphe necator]